MIKSLLLENLENEGFCATEDIGRNYSLSKTVQNDPLVELDKKVLVEKINSITELFAVSKETVLSIYYNLLLGNVILEGPPGTGKTSLAREIAKNLFNANLEEATANTEWTVYDLVGRKTLDVKDGKEIVVPENGHITNSVFKCCNQIALHEQDPSDYQATWLLIDEINRCKIDRAFGEFFTVLAGSKNQKLTLAYQNENNRNLFVPKRFRIIGTMNSVDKSFVNSFSQAFARRFNFIFVDIPKTEELIKKESDVSLKVASQEVADLLNVKVTDIEAMLVEDEVKKSLDQIEEFVKLVRFGNSSCPGILQLGTAQLIDVKKSFILRLVKEDKDTDLVSCVNWAINTKIISQLDSAFISEEVQNGFLKSIPSTLKGIKDNVQTIWGLFTEAEE